MKALKFSQTGRVELVEEPEPVAGPNETVVNVAYAGICGSDLHGILPGGFRTPPLVMGHEFSAVTQDGRSVTIRSTLGCGHCDLCRNGYEQVCPDRSIIGIDRPGGFAERVAVPNRSIVGVSDGVSLKEAALSEPLAVALRAWNRSGATQSSQVAIIGAGGIGLLILTVARHFGVHSCFVADLKPRRLEMARSSGAEHTGAGLNGDFDVIFDAVGTPQTHAASVAHLRPGGVTVWLGCRDAEPGFDALALIRSERNVLTSFAYNEFDFISAVELLSKLSFGWVEVFALDQSDRVFMDLVEGTLDAGRALLRP